MRTAFRTPALLALLATLPCAQDGVDPWSRFRGPNGSGVSEAEGLPERLGADATLWRTELPPGHSSPVLSSTRIFLTAIDGEELRTLCLDRATGEEVWSAAAPRPRREELDNRNNPASPSPVVGARSVVVFFPEFGLLAYDHAGEELWRRSLGPFDNVYGMGASPILHEGSVLLACDQNLGSYLLALDLASGEELWRADRPEAKSSHCTPILLEREQGTPDLILPGSFFLDAYDPETGAKRWWASGLCFEMKSVPVLAEGLVFVNGYGSPMNQPGNQITVEPFEEVLGTNDADGDGKLEKEEMPATRAAAWFEFVDLDGDGFLDARDWEYLTAALASQNGMLAFRPGTPDSNGDAGAASLAWAYRRSVPQLPSPLVYRDVLYMLNDSGGLMVTFEPATGEVLEHGRIEEAVDTYYASPVAGDGKVYLVSEHGTVVVLPAGGSFEPLSVTQLEERVYATPALSDGRVFLRTEEALVAFGTP
jgi:outer membrane protein assembly factor BamB